LRTTLRKEQALHETALLRCAQTTEFNSNFGQKRRKIQFSLISLSWFGRRMTGSVDWRMISEGTEFEQFGDGLETAIVLSWWVKECR
jgi:hypothetical protein